jgi:hypothetical protein
VPHVEFSLPDLAMPGWPVEESPQPPPAEESAHGRWTEAVAAAREPCVLIDQGTVIVAMSLSCARLLGFDEPPVGRGLLDGVLQLLDFSADAAALTDYEIGKIPPLLALSSGRLARGLIRVQCGEEACTLDGIATPIGDETTVAGSLTFFSKV